MIAIHFHKTDDEIIVRVVRNEHLEVLGALVGVDQDTIEDKIISAIEQALMLEDADA